MAVHLPQDILRQLQNDTPVVTIETELSLGSLHQKIREGLSYYIKRYRGEPKFVTTEEKAYLETTFKIPAAGSSENAKKMVRNRLKITRLSKVLHVDVRKAHEIFNEYYSYTSHADPEKIPTDPLKMRYFYCKEIEDIRNFYFKQRYALLKLISHIVMMATADRHRGIVDSFTDGYRKLVDDLVRGIVSAKGDSDKWCVLEYVQHLLNWDIPYDDDRFLLEGGEERSGEQFFTYGNDNRRYHLLDALCSTREQKVSLIRENHTEWCEQIIAEFDVALEILSFFMLSPAQPTFDHGVSLVQLRELFAIDEGVVSLGAPKVPLKHLEAITRGSLPDYIQILKSRISLSWIYIMNPKNAYLKSLTSSDFGCSNSLISVLRNQTSNFDATRLTDPLNVIFVFFAMFGDDENADVDEYGNAAIVTLLKLLKDVFPFGNTSFKTFLDDKSCLQLSMLQQQAIALSEKLMKTNGCFNLSTPIFGELFKICFRTADQECDYGNLCWYCSSPEGNLRERTFRVAPFYDILSAIASSSGPDPEVQYLFILEQLGSLVWLNTFEGPEFIESIFDDIPRRPSDHFIAKRLENVRVFPDDSSKLVTWEYQVNHWILLIGLISSVSIKNIVPGSRVGIDTAKVNCVELSSALHLLTTIINDGYIDIVKTNCSHYNEWMRRMSSRQILREVGDDGSGPTTFPELMNSLFLKPIITVFCEVAFFIGHDSLGYDDAYIQLFVNIIDFLLTLIEKPEDTADRNKILQFFVEPFINYTGRSSFVDVLFDVVENARSEYLRGRITTIISSLLLRLMELLSSESLYETQIKAVFEELDEDGNKKISCQELRDGLKMLGYDIPNHVVDALHRKLDTDGEGSIDYKELVTFATSGDSNKFVERVMMNSMDRAMFELQAHLSDCFIPGGKSTFECSKYFSFKVIDITFEMFMSFGLCKFSSIEEKKFLTENLLKILDCFLHNVQLVESPYSLSWHVCSHIVKKIYDEPKCGEILFQSSALYGLVAYSANNHIVGDHFGNLTSAIGTRAFGGFTETKMGRPHDKILPVDFSIVFDSLAEVAYDKIVQIALNILIHLIEFTAHHHQDLLPMILNILGHEAELPIGAVLVTKNLSGYFPCCSSLPHRLGASYFTFIVSQLTCLRQKEPENVPSIALFTSKFLSTALNAIGEINRTSRLEIISVTAYIGLANLPELAISLCSLLCSSWGQWVIDAAFNENWQWVIPASNEENCGHFFRGRADLQSDIIDVFCSLAAHHPEILSFLITGVKGKIVDNNVKIVDEHDRLQSDINILTKDSFLIDTLIGLVNGYNVLDKNISSRTILCYKLFQLIILMTEKISSNSSIAYGLMYLLEGQNVLKKLLEPLEKLTDEDFIIEIIHCDFQQKCIRLMTISLIFEFLALERFGHLHHLDSLQGRSPSNKFQIMNTFHDPANAFFEVCVHHCMYVKLDYAENAMESVEYVCSERGLMSTDLMKINSSISSTFKTSLAARWMSISKFNDEYAFDLRSSWGVVLSDGADAGRKLQEANRMLYIFETQTNLFKSWRRFLEVSIDERQPVLGIARAISSRIDYKRSKLVLDKLSRDFSDFSSVINTTAINIIQEKAGLFLYMLHHQLKSITSRTKDPRFSKVEVKKISEIPLQYSITSEIALKYLISLKNIFSAYISGASIKLLSSKDDIDAYFVSESILNNKKYIFLKTMFTSFLLLMALVGTDGSEHIKLCWMENCAITLIDYSRRLKQIMIPSDGRDFMKDLKAVDFSLFSFRNEEEKSKFQDCCILVKLVVNSLREIFLKLESDVTGILVRLDIGKSIVEILALLSAFASRYVSTYAYYSAWPDLPVPFPDPHVIAHVDLPLVSPDSKVPLDAIEEALDAIKSIFDLLGSSKACVKISLNAGLRLEILRSPLFLEYQRVLKSQPVDRARVLMGYNALNGEESKLSQCWLSCVNMITSLVQMHGDVGSVSSTFGQQEVVIFAQQVQASASFNPEISVGHLFSLINKYDELLYLPLCPVLARMSLQYICHATASAQLFLSIIRCIGTWATNLSPDSNLYRFAMEKEALKLVGYIAPNLGIIPVREDEGADDYYLEDLKKIDRVVLAVSKDERNLEEKFRKTNVAQRRYDLVLNKVRKFIERLQRDKKENAGYVQCPVQTWILNFDASFLVRAEDALLHLLIPIISFVYYRIPNASEEDRSILEDRKGVTYAVGTQIWYYSLHFGTVLRGRVITPTKVCDSLEYFSVLIDDGSEDVFVNPQFVLYKERPYIEFAFENSDRTIYSYEPVECTTDCLLNFLKFLLQRHNNTKDQNLDHTDPLTEMVSVILTKTLAHHSCNNRFQEHFHEIHDLEFPKVVEQMEQFSEALVELSNQKNSEGIAGAHGSRWVVQPSDLNDYITMVICKSREVMESRTDIAYDTMMHDSSLPRRSRSSTLASNPSHDTPRTPGTPRSPGGPSTDRKQQNSKENFWCDEGDCM